MTQGKKDGYHPQFLQPADKGQKIAIIYTAWNISFTSRLLEGARAVLMEHGYSDAQIGTFECPGAFELPLSAAWCFSKGYHAVLCLGAIIRGDTPHFDYVSSAATQGILQVGLEFKKPCIFGVLTVNTPEQAEERIGGKHGHKGREAAETALHMLAMQTRLEEAFI